jgi:hypothetical protein
MADASNPRPTARVSLRRLFALVAVAAVGCVALKNANAWWVAGMASFTLLTFMAAVVEALVDRGPRQVFAIGFAACAAIYGGMLVSSRWFYPGGQGSVMAIVNREMDPDAGILPTTRLLGLCFDAIVELWNIDPQTGKRLKKMPADQYGGPNLAVMGNTIVAVPRPEAFMPVGQCLWMLLLAYAGGTFAKFVDARRRRDGRPSNASPWP